MAYHMINSYQVILAEVAACARFICWGKHVIAEYSGRQRPVAPPRGQNPEQFLSRARSVALVCICSFDSQLTVGESPWFLDDIDSTPQVFMHARFHELARITQAVADLCLPFPLHLSRLQVLGGSPQQLSCLHTSTSLESKNWEKRNLKVYPPQLPDEPRRPAVSLSARR